MTNYAATPADAETTVPSASAGAPKPLMRAVLLMWVGAALSLLSFIAAATTFGSVRDQLRRDDPSLTSSDLNTAVGVYIASYVVLGLVAVAPWLWMAWANRRGKRWARIVGTLLFAINTVTVIGSFFQDAGSVTFQLLPILIWVVGLVATVLMWNRQSSLYYLRSKATA